MKKSAVVAIVLSMLTTQAWAYENLQAGYSVQDKNPYYKVESNKVYGFSNEMAADIQLLKAALDKAKSVDTSLFEEGADATLSAAIEEAQAVYDNKEATQDEVDAAAAKIVDAAKRSGARVSGPIPLPTDKEIVTILRAVHKYKDSREQFELRTHKRLIDVLRPTAKTTEALQGLELPAGVDIVMEIK